MKQVKIIFSGLLFVFAIISMVFFPEKMMSPAGKIPIGTFISWSALLFYAMFWYYLLPDHLNAGLHKYLIVMKNIHFTLALLWGFISALLADNWQFSFQNRPIRFDIWIFYTAFLIAFPILLLAFLGVRKLINLNK